MRKNLKNKLCCLLIFMLSVVLYNCSKSKKEDKSLSNEEYTCSMHPHIVQKQPGSCPICGMDLVKKSGHEQSLEITEGIDHLLKPTNSATVSSIKTVSPVTRSMEVAFKANGVITYDTRQSYAISIRYGGRIEKLFIKYNFQPIKKGQKILEMYSPDLVTAQRELIFLLKDDPTNTPIIEASKQKLRLLGVTEAQINQIVKSKKESYSFTVYSPYNGYITEESVLNRPDMNQQASSTSRGMGMGEEKVTSASSAPANFSSETGIREGMYLNAGQTVFKIVNTEKVWAEFSIYQKDAPFVKKNAPVTIKLNTEDSSTIESKVGFIQPFFKVGEELFKVRVYLNNRNGKFKVGTLAFATFKSKTENAKWIPASAAVDLGNNTIVFVKTQDVFKPHKVTVKRRAGDLLEIIDGLEDSSQIAVNGQFMVDSESFIRTNQ